MNTATPNSRIALLAAARISRRRYPKVRRVLAGREPIQMASRARLIPAASVKTCAASASRARLWETRPPTISMAVSYTHLVEHHDRDRLDPEPSRLLLSERDPPRDGGGAFPPGCRGQLHVPRWAARDQRRLELEHRREILPAADQGHGSGLRHPAHPPGWTALNDAEWCDGAAVRPVAGRGEPDRAGLPGTRWWSPVTMVGPALTGWTGTKAMALTTRRSVFYGQGTCRAGPPLLGR